MPALDASARARRGPALLASLALILVATLASPVDTRAASESFVIHGFGRDTLGGRGGRTIRVTNLKDSGTGSLRAALEASGRRIVRFEVAGIIDLVHPIKVKQPYVTVDGSSAPGAGIQVRGESLFIAADEVIIRHVRFRPGDRTADTPSDLDGLTINGGSHVVLDHVEALWGPDIGGLAILNDSTDITVQYSILGEGLLRSRHPEAWEDADGHSMALNIVGLSRTAFPRRVTIFRNLITTSQTRVPKVAGAQQLDVINNVIYDFAEGPYGNPQSMNFVNNLLRTGPAPAAAGLRQLAPIWRAEANSTFPSLFAASVYLEGNKVEGITGGRKGPGSVFSPSPTHRLSVMPEPVDGLAKRVVEDVGATLPARDAVTVRLIGNVRDHAGRFMNGEGAPPPNPAWP